MNQVSLIDEANYSEIQKYKWCVTKAGEKYYATRYVTEMGKRHKIYLHRMLMGNPEGMQVDHINSNSLDNRLSNLRLCTSKQNHQNRKANSDSTSAYVGVSHHCHNQSWIAKCCGVYLGSFVSEMEAALAYDTAASATYGQFANLNFK